MGKSSLIRFESLLKISHVLDKGGGGRFNPPNPYLNVILHIYFNNLQCMFEHFLPGLRLSVLSVFRFFFKTDILQNKKCSIYIIHFFYFVDFSTKRCIDSDAIFIALISLLPACLMIYE